MKSDEIRTPIGIDLGTTNCVVAGISATGHSQILSDEFDQSRTPSAICFTPEGYRVGREAVVASALDSTGFVESPKRDLGLAESTTVVHGRVFPPEVLQACILQHLKRIAERNAAAPIACVIGVPAFFDQARRDSTRQAAEMAGLELLELVNEPTAAALAYGEFHGFLDRSGSPKRTERLLVYDLGGGTFDVTLLQLAQGEVRTLGTDGDVQLGGNDWDQRLFEYLAQKFEARFHVDPRDDPSMTLRLRRHARELKEALSVRQSARVHFEVGNDRLAMDLSREQFELLTSDLLERTAQTTREIVRQCGLTFREIDRVLLIGGTSRMPAVRKMLRELTGQLPDQSVNPDEGVARGAAIRAAARLAEQNGTNSQFYVSLIDVVSHSLGIEGIELHTGRKENRILIPRNTPLPATIMVPFATRRDNQETLVIRVLEGESLDPAECATIGHAVLDSLPEKLRKGHPLQVIYSVGDDTSLEVRLRIRDQPGEWTMRLEQTSAAREGHTAAWRQVLSGPGRFVSFEDVLRQVLGIKRS